jgi:hypothetical protein
MKTKSMIRAVLAFGIALTAATSVRYASADFPWSPWTSGTNQSSCLGDTGTPGHSTINSNNNHQVLGWCDNNKCDFARPVFAVGCTSTAHTTCTNTTSYGGTVGSTNDVGKLVTHRCQISQ